MAGQIWSFSQRLIAGSLLGLMWMTPVQAQLRSAQVYRLQNNNVQLQLRGKPKRQARVGDSLVPLDALQTFKATARLLFNEGTLALVDRTSIFRFRQGLRRRDVKSSLCVGQQQQLDDGGDTVNRDRRDTQNSIENSASPCPLHVASTNLSQAPDTPTTPVESETILELLHGVVLVVVPPDGRVSAIETPKTLVEIQAANTAEPSESNSSQKTSPSPAAKSGNAALIVHQGSTTKVFALTEGLTVSDPSGTKTISPLGGQAVEASATGVGEPVEFNLQDFYRTYPLAEGLGPGHQSHCRLRLRECVFERWSIRYLHR